MDHKRVAVEKVLRFVKENSWRSMMPWEVERVAMEALGKDATSEFVREVTSAVVKELGSDPWNQRGGVLRSEPWGLDWVDGNQ
jgi:hypothetical protein